MKARIRDYQPGDESATAYVCLKTGDRVGLLGFDSQVRLYSAPQGTMNAVNILQAAGFLSRVL